jgi:hypothetical protein
MGDKRLDDWGPTRSPQHNKEIRAQNKAEDRARNAYLTHLEAFRQRRREKVPSVAEEINLLIPILLNSWQEQVDSAITDVPFPADSESGVYWYLALAGNLVWAGTCFLNPVVAAERTLIAVLSFSGAAYGSGAARQFAGSSSPPDPSDTNGAKELIRQNAAKARGKLESLFQGKRLEWASRVPRLEDWGSGDPEIFNRFNQYIWEKMFPSIAYNDDRFDEIRLRSVAMVKGAYADYMRQWKTFERTNNLLGGAERKRRHIVFKPVLRVSFGTQPLWDASESRPAVDLNGRLHFR